MFNIKFGRLHTIDNANVTAPAASRQKLKNPHEPINFFDGILLSSLFEIY